MLNLTRPLVAFLMVSMALAGCLGDDDPSAVSDGPEATVPPAVQEPESNVTPEPVVEPWPHHPSDGLAETIDTTVESFDGHLIPTTIYRPLIANATVQVPVLLQSHGFTGSRATSDNAFLDHVKAGFGVVSFDQRGHGDAIETSTVGFMQPDIEVYDAMAVIDHIAGLDWVLKERDDPTDPRLGTIGYSYGGAFQLMTAVFDDRIDAMVPEITWHNITTALAPNGAIKSGWVDLFYVAGNAQQSVAFNEEFHKGFAWATATNELPAGQAPEVPDLVTEFNQASPESYPGKIDVPTLLVQGMVDTLFPLNQAVWNYHAIAATGAPVRLYSHLAGHVLNTESLAPGQSPIPVGLQGVPGGRPCGDQADLEIAWHQKYLLDLDVDLGPKVCLALEDGRAVKGDAFPLPGTQMHAYDVGGPFPVVQAAGGGSLVPLATLEFAGEGETVIAGIPRLSGSITTPGPDSIVYFSLYRADAQGVMEHIVDDQVRPLRIKGPNTDAVAFDMELGGIATAVPAGGSLILVASSAEPMFFGNAERLPSGVVLDGLQLQLPALDTPSFA